jgi:hypothetical protein
MNMKQIEPLTQVEAFQILEGEYDCIENTFETCFDWKEIVTYYFDWMFNPDLDVDDEITNEYLYYPEILERLFSGLSFSYDQFESLKGAVEQAFENVLNRKKSEYTVVLISNKQPKAKPLCKMKNW